MPELPEVETVRRGLAAHVIGSRVDSIEVQDARSLKRHAGGAKNFDEEVVGSTFSAVVRRGKFLWLPLGDSHALVCHLGMSGQVLLRSCDFEPDPLTRITLRLSGKDGKVEMRFVDQRLFGGMFVDNLQLTSDQLPGGFSPESETTTMIPTSVGHIARDPLDPALDMDSVISLLSKRSAGIKRLLLDQRIVSGIGNIYADEALWRSKLYFDTPAGEISRRKLTDLMRNVVEVLTEAVERGGTSFDQQYKNVNGESGYFSQDLEAYGRSGLPCSRCGTKIARASWANRSSYFCPKCQRL